ncbi:MULTISPECIES: DotU family type VI secretion system protein [unclassified Variovorax]|uniref:DotU family type VI secretion system protein n=1 Tax=unclassified Variovorax TaxID=663243 RepID=UPI00076D489B|nr:MULTISPECIES: DotU family type VI secretion system protein [unclassified Variovorax]KWT93050.1 Outer membrane protein ImpK/VasF, OmpA/MotB domain [Variovorax sp. WDL1]PNG51921.1 putative lipoprotein YiaD [Variovorax sp. B2]PNG54268.1 putative lipoprotein YiaD [Variovorax sp. B4]VTV11756.1 Chemotaxis protein MotB [Variovorax sp. WDL1]
MTTPDPFAAFESERTVIKPKPRAPGGAAPLPPPAPMGGEPLPAELGELGLLNPVVSAAGKLLVLMGQLRNMVHAPNVPALRASTADAVNQFDAAVRRAGVANDSVMAARYVLCTALDEAVANTPWGAQAGWNKQSLLVQFHNETWGGEKVFQLLARLAQDVPTHRPLLELIYSVLALGFEGRYRVVENGRAQLDSVRQRLAELIAKDRPPVEPELSPHWRGQAAGTVRLRESLPIWVFAAGFALLLALAWFGFRLALNQRSDATYAAVSSLRVPNVQIAPPAILAKSPRLAKFLEAEIRQGLVTVTDEADRSTVRLRGDSFFGSGSADPMAQSLPVLHRIGQALAEVKGEVLITGHSDNQPIRSMRYPSNWHLSAARADAVKGALSTLVEPARMRSDGKADAEPVAANDTPANRARNRRVEIVLLAPPERVAAELSEARR